MGIVGEQKGMENIKDNEKDIFWSILYFNKMYDYSMTFGIWDAIEE